jgi:hypothetical protein
MAYITTANAIATTAPPKFRGVLAIAPEWLVVEGLPEEGDAAPVNAGDEVTVAVFAGRVVGIEAFPVNPGIVSDGRGDYKRNQRRQSPCTLSLPVCNFENGDTRRKVTKRINATYPNITAGSL